MTRMRGFARVDPHTDFEINLEVYPGPYPEGRGPRALDPLITVRALRYP